MLNDFYYYLILPLTATAGLLGFYYVFNSEKSKLILANWGWTISKAYVYCNGWGEQFTSYFYKIEEESDIEAEDEDEETLKQSIILYDAKEKNNYVLDEYNDSSSKLIRKVSPSIMFLTTPICGVTYFKRTREPEKKDSEYLTLTEKPFVQVEYLEGDHCVLDIHENLTGFYVNGNMILDKTFLEWYLHYYYNIYLSDDYTLRIFDKDVNMFNLTRNGSILIENNGYVIIQDAKESIGRPRADAECETRIDAECKKEEGTVEKE